MKGWILMHSDSANRAGRAFCLAAENNPELAGKIRSAGQALAKAAEVNAADMIEAAGQLEQWGFTRPIELEDWRRVALAGGLPFEVVRAGDFTARDAMDAAGGLVDRATVEGKHGRQQPATIETATPRGKPTGPARADNGAPALLAFSGLATYHGYERIGENAAKVTKNIGSPIRGEALRELTRERLPDGTEGKPVAAGAITNFWQVGFGQPGCKGDGKHSYNRRCKDARALADALLKIDKAIEAGTFGKAETPGQSIWATALDGIEDATLPAARRRTKGKLARTTARYPQNDSDDDSDDDAPAFETGFNFQDLAEAEDAEDGG